MQQEQDEQEEEEHFRKIFEDALQDYDSEGEGEEDYQEVDNQSNSDTQISNNNRDYHHMLIAMANQLLAEKLEKQQLEAAIKLSMNQNSENA